MELTHRIQDIEREAGSREKLLFCLWCQQTLLQFLGSDLERIAGANCAKTLDAVGEAFARHLFDGMPLDTESQRERLAALEEDPALDSIDEEVMEDRDAYLTSCLWEVMTVSSLLCDLVTSPRGDTIERAANGACQIVHGEMFIPSHWRHDAVEQAHREYRIAETFREILRRGSTWNRTQFESSLPRWTPPSDT